MKSSVSNLYSSVSTLFVLLLVPQMANAACGNSAVYNSGSMVWPVGAGQSPQYGHDCVSQDFAEYGTTDKQGIKYHTGLDIETNEDESATVLAVADGYIARYIPNGTNGCEDKPGNCTDHGFGNTLIIDHPQFGRGINTQYSHMSAVSSSLLSSIKSSCKQKIGTQIVNSVPVLIDEWNCPKNGVSVVQGEQLGNVGRTEYGCSDQNGYNHKYCTIGVHLHFEVKRAKTLWPPPKQDPNSPEFGYTLDHPSTIGYRGPVHYLHNATNFKNFVPVHVTQDGDGVALRVGPEEDYYETTTGLPTASYPQHYYAPGEAPATANCDQGWYKLSKDDYFPPNDLFVDPDSGKAIWPDLWVCKGNNGVAWVVPD